jgi:hypothetical protein
MELSEIARWTPIRFDFSGTAPAVDWADLSEERFTEPFFDETVMQWASGPRSRQLVRTGLDALVALDAEPSLDPAGMIFHLSRCGSTLVSRLLSTLPGVVVISEPAPLNSLLGLDPSHVDRAALVQVVRLVVRALGRRRHGDEQQLVLKCTSWNVRQRSILAEAFPDTPWVWVQRDPARVVASLLAEPPGWLRLQDWPQAAKQRFGMDPAAVPAMTAAEFAAQAVGSMLAAAGDADPAGRLCIDQADLPDAIWRRVTAHFRLVVDDDAIARMTAESRFYSKDSAPREFTGDAPEQRAVTDEIRQAAQRFAEPGYRLLSSHR